MPYQSIASQGNRLLPMQLIASDNRLLPQVIDYLQQSLTVLGRMHVLRIFLQVKPILSLKTLIKHIYTHIVKVRYSQLLRGCLVATKMIKA